MSISESPPALATSGGLEQVPLLALMPTEVRKLVEVAFTRVSFAFGEVIVAEGDEADALYVLASGTARALKRGEHGEEVPLNVLRPGDSFGERALLEEQGRRTATVRASSPVEALKLEKGVFQALVRSNPSVQEYVELHVRRHELRDFLRVYSAFARLPPEGMALLLDGLQPVGVRSGEVVIRQGEAAGPMYVVRGGHLRAFIDRDGQREAGAFLRKGDFFGEVSLFRGSPRAATVEAVSDCELLALQPELFQRLIAEHAKFREEIEQRVSQYDYKSFARVPLDFAEELLPADTGAQEIVGLDQVDAVEEAVAEPTQEEAVEQWEGFSRPKKPIRRFPHLYQVDEMDCGAASLAIICRYFGRKVSLARVRQSVHTAIDGTSLLGIARGAEALGLASRTVKASKSRLDEMPLPAIVHWENNHWLVLYDVDDEHVRISDPARGRRRLKRAEFEQKWSGYAAFFAYTAAFEHAPEESSRIEWLREFFRPYRRTFVTAFALALLAAGAEMLIPVLSKFIVDKVIVRRDTGVLTLVVAGMFGALLLTILATVVQRFLLSKIAVRVDRESLDFLSGKLLALPMSYFNARRTGDIERRLNGMRLVRQFMVQHGVQGLAAGTQVVVAVAVMFAFSWRLALVYLATMPLYVGLMRYSAKVLRPTYDSLEESWGKYQSRQIDSIKGIETVKAMGAEIALGRLLLGQFNQLSHKLFRADLTMMLYEAAIQLVAFLSLALFLWIGALQVLHHNLTVGELVSFNALVVLANGPIVAVLWLWDQLQYSSILLNRLNDIIEQTPEQAVDNAALQSVKSLSGHIRFKRMSFEYPGAVSSPVLEDIEFEVEPGTTAAIVGRSGSGKTTLIKCLAGLLEPTSGTILYDGVELTSLNYRELRRHIGFVLQENHMFDATIAENIAFGEEKPDPERVVWAARVANAGEFIERLPLGYETRIGETGLLLSGGQRQRIAIARAVYHRPAVLVLDEATSALDSESERAVKQNMDQLLRDRTSFVIAHRLSTVRDADVILVLEKGRLVEHGTHDELMARQGLYYYLCSQQLEM
jgi:ATP-binding cassette subfamily B protein